MFRRVVLPTDGSKNAEKGVLRGLDMAKAFNIEVLAVYVIDRREFAAVSHRSMKASLREALHKHGKEALDYIKRLAKERGVKVDAKIIEGVPHEAIIREATKEDIIVMAPKGKSNISRILLGSVTDRVVHHAKCTVAVVR